jgi:hypothetical protein
VFQDLDATLLQFFKLSGAPDELRRADVSFQTPDKDFTADSPTLNLFLHHVGENRQLRANAPALEFSANTGAYSPRLEPLRVDCTYLVTTWSAKAAGTKIAEEHGLLGLALSWISRHPVLPRAAQTGSLAPPQNFPITATIAQLTPEETLSHFWSALGVAPRPAFTLIVTVELPLPVESEPVAPVRTIRIQSGGTVPPQPSIS